MIVGIETSEQRLELWVIYRCSDNGQPGETSVSFIDEQSSSFLQSILAWLAQRGGAPAVERRAAVTGWVSRVKAAQLECARAVLAAREGED